MLPATEPILTILQLVSTVCGQAETAFYEQYFGLSPKGLLAMLSLKNVIDIYLETNA
jgi:hypothetical protein